MEDSDRIRGLLAGEARVLAEVGRWVRAAASSYRDLCDGEDLEQEMLMALLESLRAGRFRGDSSLRTYVHRQVHYTCIDRLRAAKTRPMVTLEGLDLPSAEPSPLGRLARREAVAIALRVLAQVPAECRDLWRGILAGESYGEMSRRSGVSEGTLRVRALRCRRRALELRNEGAGRPTVGQENRENRR